LSLGDARCLGRGKKGVLVFSYWLFLWKYYEIFFIVFPIFAILSVHIPSRTSATCFESYGNLRVERSSVSYSAIGACEWNHNNEIAVASSALSASSSITLDIIQVLYVFINWFYLRVQYFAHT
jgi:hypothetical protein